MLITSKNNPLVKELCSLKEKKGRAMQGSFLVEGRKMVKECLSSSFEVKRIILREDMEGALDFSNAGAELVLLGRDAFSSISDEKTPQGIIAEVKIPALSPVPPKGRCLLLDGLQDPSNVGAIIRTAAAAGYEELYLCNSADPFAPKSVRASMSGVFYVKIMRGSRGEVFKALENVPILTADMGGEDVFSYVPPQKFCLAIGNEGCGLSQEVRGASQGVVGIPMEGRMESLNAAVSAGIIMYALRQNKI